MDTCHCGAGQIVGQPGQRRGRKDLVMLKLGAAEWP